MPTLSTNRPQLTIVTRDRTGNYWYLMDAYAASFTTGENGFKDATWSLDRPFSFSMEDIGLNYQVLFINNRGDTAWHGRLESVQLQVQGGKTSVVCTATGYWSSLYDGFYIGTLATSTTPEAMLTSLVGLPIGQIVNDATGFVVTGLVAQGYQTPDGGTSMVRVGDVVLDVCSRGTSTTGDRVIPLVLTGRKLITRRLTATPVPAYSVSFHTLANLTVQRSLSTVWNRVRTRYKSSADSTLQYSVVEDTALQAAYGIDFTGVAGVTSLLRVTSRDITGLNDGTIAAVADAMGNAVLNVTKRVHNEVTVLTVARDKVVTDTALGQEIPNWAVQAGNWLQVPDMFSRLSDPVDSLVGRSLGAEALQTMVYISQTDYDVTTGQLTVTPGAGSVAL